MCPWERRRRMEERGIVRVSAFEDTRTFQARKYLNRRPSWFHGSNSGFSLILRSVMLRKASSRIKMYWNFLSGSVSLCLFLVCLFCSFRFFCCPALPSYLGSTMGNWSCRVHKSQTWNSASDTRDYKQEVHLHPVPSLG